MLGGITVVVSPLVSLIQDQVTLVIIIINNSLVIGSQVTKLTGLGISADHMSGDDYGRQNRIYNQMRGAQAGLFDFDLIILIFKCRNYVLINVFSCY